MNRSLVLCMFAVALTASIGTVTTANTVNISLDLFYADSDSDLFVDAAAQGTWQLTATADEEGLAGLATQLTGIAGLDGSTHRPNFSANSDITPVPTFDTFKQIFDDDGTPKPWDTDTDGDSSTLEMLFGQVPVASPGPQELTYDVGKLGGTTPNVDELGNSTFLSVGGVSMTDGVFLAYGTFGAGSSVAINLDITPDPSAATGANLFTVEGTASDPPAVTTIVSAANGTLNIQTRTNLGVRAGDISLDGLVNAVDASPMFGNWDGGASATHTWQEGDVSGDKFINAVDASAMFSSWTGDPGPSGPGNAVAEYDYATGEIIVSMEGVNNWFVRSASFGLTADNPSHAPIVPGSLASDNDEIIGETGFSPGTGTDVSLGFVAEAGLPLGDLTLSYVAGLGTPEVTVDVVYLNAPPVPEPATLVLAAFGLCGVLATRRRRVA